jgi:hypothetical protein
VTRRRPLPACSGLQQWAVECDMDCDVTPFERCCSKEVDRCRLWIGRRGATHCSVSSSSSSVALDRTSESLLLTGGLLVRVQPEGRRVRVGVGALGRLERPHRRRQAAPADAGASAELITHFEQATIRELAIDICVPWTWVWS